MEYQRRKNYGIQVLQVYDIRVKTNNLYIKYPSQREKEK